MLFIILQKFYTSVQASGELLQASEQLYSNNPMHEKYTVLQITTTPFLYTVLQIHHQVAIILLSNAIHDMISAMVIGIQLGKDHNETIIRADLSNY